MSSTKRFRSASTSTSASTTKRMRRGTLRQAAGDASTSAQAIIRNEDHADTQMSSPPAAQGQPQVDILSLPHEILAAIFDNICFPNSDHINTSPQGMVHYTLARVCRKFRDVVLGHAPLWTFADSKRSLGYVQRQLMLSKQSLLTVSSLTGRHHMPRGGINLSSEVHVNDSQRGCECPTFWTLVAQHAARWRKVEVSDDHEHHLNAIPLHLDLPNLEELVIETEDVWHNPDADSRACTTWRVPKLKTVWSTQRVLDIHPSLLSFKLETLNLNLIGKVPFRKLAQFLGSSACSELEQLSLAYGFAMSGMDMDENADEDDQTTGLAVGPIIVGSVKTLRLMFTDNREQREAAFEDVLNKLAFPNVEDITFECPMASDRGVSDDEDGWNPLVEEVGGLYRWLAQSELRQLKFIYVELKVPSGKAYIVKDLEEEGEMGMDDGVEGVGAPAESVPIGPAVDEGEMLDGADEDDLEGKTEVEVEVEMMKMLRHKMPENTEVRVAVTYDIC